MKLSISNIAWEAKYDYQIYDLMKKHGYCGLEIAPTRIIPQDPYQKVEEAKQWYARIRESYGFLISSMQSIWFGRQEKLFGSQEEREKLSEYTKKAIDFAEVIGCRNLVFGCPKNRNVPANADLKVDVPFFRELGNYAIAHGTIIGMEANPPIYGTNYINDTLAAFRLIEAVNSPGFRLNLDVGTMIQNGEAAEELRGRVHLINHVHISEPRLRPIERRFMHEELAEILSREGYQGFISIEMGKTDDISGLEEKLRYVRGVFK